MHVAFAETALPGDEVAEWIALQQVTVVDQYAVLHLSSGYFDQCRSSGQTHRQRLLILKIIIVDDMNVNVRCFEYAKLNVSVREQICRCQQRGQRQCGRQDWTCCHGSPLIGSMCVVASQVALRHPIVKGNSHDCKNK